MNVLDKIERKLTTHEYIVSNKRYSPSIGVYDRGTTHTCTIIVDHILDRMKNKVYTIERHISLNSNYFTLEIFDYNLGYCIYYDY
ncbi:hypothetical protein [Thalassobellus citreus]|uniref:hypothetical protein n=1 Tax=Thalassobellus citreus TaxID=3367752 RepID=UPI0037B49DD6